MGGISSFWALAAALGLVLLIGLLKQRPQLLLNFLARMAVGGACIFFLNDFLASRGIALAVGLNPVSLLTAGSLGIGGVALLYGIVACKFL